MWGTWESLSISRPLKVFKLENKPLHVMFSKSKMSSPGLSMDSEETLDRFHIFVRVSNLTSFQIFTCTRVVDCLARPALLAKIPSISTLWFGLLQAPGRDTVSWDRSARLGPAFALSSLGPRLSPGYHPVPSSTGNPGELLCQCGRLSFAAQFEQLCQ